MLASVCSYRESCKTGMVLYLYFASGFLDVVININILHYYKLLINILYLNTALLSFLFFFPHFLVLSKGKRLMKIKTSE